MWKTLNAEFRESNRLNVEEYKTKAMDKVKDKTNLFENKGRGTCSLYDLGFNNMTCDEQCGIKNTRFRQMKFG